MICNLGVGGPNPSAGSRKEEDENDRPLFLSAKFCPLNYANEHEIDANGYRQYLCIFSILFYLYNQNSPKVQVEILRREDNSKAEIHVL